MTKYGTRIQSNSAIVKPPTSTVTRKTLPSITWTPGDNYFKLNGTPTFLFSRNIAGYTPDQWETMADWAYSQGNHFVRVVTESPSMGGMNGYGYGPQGDILEDWSNHWEHFFDVAEDLGLYVLPIFTGWLDWTLTSPSSWNQNPLNAANGGPATIAFELFTPDSPTQRTYANWFKAIIGRWQVHKNILGWEVVDEINLIDDLNHTRLDFVALAVKLATIARQTDLNHRPIISSVTGESTWTNFLQVGAADFINFHSYPTDWKLDRAILDQVPRLMRTYQKPVLIGECGLDWHNPDTVEGEITHAQNASTGIQHAIWAQLVAGAMNGRGLWWEDGQGIFFPSLGGGNAWGWVETYKAIESVAVNFIKGVDMTGFKPIETQASSQLFGAALGNEKFIIGWFRDAACEPPDQDPNILIKQYWNLQPIQAGESIDLTVPGSSANWKVDFYDARSGTNLTPSRLVKRNGHRVIVRLPYFTDGVVFKLYTV